MNRPMIAALFMALLLVVYLAFTANYAWILIRDDSALANAMGYALGILPLLGAWGLVAELIFARRSAALTMELERAQQQRSEISDNSGPRSRKVAATRSINNCCFSLPPESAAPDAQRNQSSWENPSGRTVCAISKSS